MSESIQSGRGWRARLGRIVDSFGIGLIFCLLCVVFWTQSDIFLTLNNFSIILNQTAVNIIIAVGMTFVICAAEIDLSVGSLLAVCGVTTAFLLQVDPDTALNLPMRVASAVTGPLPDLLPFALSWWLVAVVVFLVLAILPGAVAGGAVGAVVARLGVPSFVVSLGFMMFHRGFARYMTNAAPVLGMPPQITLLGAGVWFEVFGFRVTYATAIAVVIVIVGALLLTRTAFGRNVLAVGGNQKASYLSGVPVRWTRFLVFVVSGTCVSIAAIVQTSRMFIGDSNAGEGYELDAIAAVIIGGTSLFGGKGSVIGTLFGALIIGVLRNGLDLMEVTDHVKQMVIGAMIIFAVLLDYYRRKLYRQTSSS